MSDCKTCAEYDSDNGYCPKYCEVIRRTVEELMQDREEEMSDLISRDAAIEAIDKNRQDLLSLGMDGAEHILVHYGRRVIEEQPTIDPVKHGRWIMQGTAYGCSLCGEGVIHPFHNYCPNCGATMMEGEEDE